MTQDCSELQKKADRAIASWKSGDRSEADAAIADIVRRIKKMGACEQVLWRVVTECGFANLAHSHRPASIEGAEILSATWEKLTLEEILKFRGDCNVRTWVYRIALNTARDLQRKEARPAGIKQQAETWSPPASGQFEGSTLHGFRVDLESARENLSDDENLLLDMWLECGDRSGALIARTLGREQRTVRNQLNRLFEKLSVDMDDPYRNKRSGRLD